MALVKRYFPTTDPEGNPLCFFYSPDLFDGSKSNISELITWAAANWTKSTNQTIFLQPRTVNETGETYSHNRDRIFSGGQGLATIDSVEWSLRNDIPGWDLYKGAWKNTLQCFKDEGYTIDHVAMYAPITGLGLTNEFESGAFTVLQVAQQMYAGDTTDLPKLDVSSLSHDQYATRTGFDTIGLWNAWTRYITGKAWKRCFAAVAREVFPTCITSYYDWSTFDYTAQTHWTNVGSATDRSHRTEVVPDLVSAPVLYLNRIFFDTLEEAHASLAKVSLPCVPWIGGRTRTSGGSGSEDWSYNSSGDHDALLDIIEDHGCERVMIY